MKSKKLNWAFLALVAFIALLLLLPPFPKPKARAVRIQTVNHVASVSMTMPDTNALPVLPTNK